MSSGSRGLLLTIVGVACFNFWHWFRPSEPYLVDILKLDFNIPEEEVYHDVYPWSSYGLLPATLLSAACFEVFGFGTALLLAAVADVTTVVLVLVSAGSIGPLLASQLTFALSFAAVFSVTATLFALLPPEWYQKASSYSRAAALVGTILSSLLGQVLVSAGQRWATLWGTAAGTSVSLLVAAAMLCLRLLRPFATRAAPHSSHDELGEGGEAATDCDDSQRPQHQKQKRSFELGDSRRDALDAVQGAEAVRVVLRDDDDRSVNADDGDDEAANLVIDEDVASVALSEGSSLWGITPAQATPRRVWERLHKVALSARASYSSPVVLSLSLWSACLRAAHTLVLTYWQPLLDQVRSVPDGSGNGVIYATAYVCAAAATCLPALWETVACRACLRRTGCVSGHRRGSDNSSRLCSSCCCGGGAGKANDDAVQRGGYCGTAVLVAAAAPAACCLGVMAVAGEVWVAAGALVLFHAVGEALLAVGAAWIGVEMVRVQQLRASRVETRRGQHSLAEEALLAAEEEPAAADEEEEGRGRRELEDSHSELRGTVRASKGVYFAAVLGLNALLGMVLQLVVQASIGGGEARLGLRWQFGVFAGVVLLGVVVGLVPLALSSTLRFAHR